ncbi:unnamed protein product [Porites evermanni]|uniref:Uncharacterized protein n=1 Tax=Porites evermanni TaxID=104178 RepID=A0ABN8SSQ5_9CNID|nr:unnamed protein product [Porites evermanni]
MPLAGVLCASDILGGWPSVFYVFGGVGILWSFIWMMFTYNRPANHPRISIKERAYIHATIGAGQDKGRRKYDTPWFAIFTSPAVWGIIVANVCNNWGFYTFLTCLPSYFKEVLNFSISQNGLLSAVPFVCMWVTGIGSGQLADWMRENNVLSTGEVRKVLATGGYLIPACLMVATSYVGYNSTSLAVVLFSLALGASNLNAATYGVNHLDIAPRFSGVLMGITNSAAPIPGIIGPFVVGLLKDNQVCFSRNDYVWPLSRASTLSACRRSENSFQFHLVICFCISGYLIPACLMVATSYVGYNSTSLAVVLFSLALGASNLNAATYGVNHLDIAPRFSGVLMGITNSAAPIPGIIGPFVVGLLKDNQVCFSRNDYVVFRRG